MNQHVNNVKYISWVIEVGELHSYRVYFSIKTEFGNMLSFLVLKLMHIVGDVMMQSIPQSLLVAHELASMILEYRRECTPSDVVQSLSCPDTHLSSGSFKNESPLAHGGLDGSPDAVSCSSGALKNATISSSTTGPVEYTHLLRMQSSGADIVHGKTKWRVKDRYVAAAH